MRYTPRKVNTRDPDEALYDSLAPVIKGLNMSLIELTVFRGKGGTVQIKAVVYRDGITGVDDCSRVHRGILPRLELAFPGQEIYLEVSSPGINRTIKDGSEFVHYIGKGVKCYRTDISDWTEGVLCAADDKGIVLRMEDKGTALPYEIIAKAMLNE
jgi:ribosome maturation factor RimP